MHLRVKRLTSIVQRIECIYGTQARNLEAPMLDPY